MATFPTPEECGRKVLDVFQDFGVRPGKFLPYGSLLARWTENSWAPEDLPIGIGYALDNGWIEQSEERETFLILTQTGFVEM